MNDDEVVSRVALGIPESRRLERLAAEKKRSFRVLCGSGYKLAVRRRWRESLSRVDQRGCRRGIFEGMAQVSKAIPAKKQPLVKSLHQRPDAPWRTRDRDIPRWVASPQSPTPFLLMG